MNIYQILTSINKKYGGPSYTVPALCQALHDINVRNELLFLGPGAIDQQYTFQAFGYSFFGPRKVGFSPGMNKYLLSKVTDDDIVHIHGLWMMANISPGKIAKSKKAKLILTPRGMLADWSLKQSSIKKKIVGALGQNSVIHGADCIHATAESEYEDIRSFGYKGPVAIIPNGVNIPKLNNKNKENKRIRKVVFLSRIHIKKGVEILIEAWSKISDKFPDVELIICGPGDKPYLNKIIEKISENKKHRIKYIEPVYGSDKDDFLQDASIFVLPTFNENFGVVVAEALSNSVPVIVSTGAPWKEVISEKCGWWVDNTSEAMSIAIANALSLSDESLETMGASGREWVEKDFSWFSIGKKMQYTYDWLHGKIEKPSFIRLT